MSLPLLLSFLTWPTLIVAAILLLILLVIDLRHYLLPDKYVFPFGLCGLIFHASLQFDPLPLTTLILGALMGGGLLWIVRWGGTKYYKQEAMGLGDVKLLTAAGLWLGPEHVVTAIMFGAMAGLVHGLAVAAGRAAKSGTFSINRLIIPAGPGFIVGIVGVFAYVIGPNIPFIFNF